MKKILSTIFAVTFFIFSAFSITACSKKIQSVSFEKTQIELSVGDFELLNYTITSKGNDDFEYYTSIEWISSNEDIATVSNVSDAYFYKNTGEGFLTIKAKSVGTCTITIKADDQTANVDVSVLLDPKISVYQRQENSFYISTYLPADTKIEVSLTGIDYRYSQQVALQENSINGGSTTVSFQTENTELIGTYTLNIRLCDIATQPDNVKKIIGAHGQYLTGKDVEILNAGKTVEFEKDYDLPYKTDLEKIQETPYSELTKGQMLTIIYWIEDRYEYYDKKAGYYTGDKYTKTIFNEAAERYNKTYLQISTIWDRSYELKYT